LALYLTGRDARRMGTEARADTAFASLLRKYLGGAKLTALEKPGYDRVVRFDFEAFESDEDEEAGDRRDDGRVVQRSLVVELIGRAANVFLLEQDRVLATLRERAEPLTTYREPAPPAGKIDPFDCTEERLNEIIALRGGDVAEAARRDLIGFDPLFARELKKRAEATAPGVALQNLLSELFDQPPRASLYSSAPLDEIRSEIARAGVSLALAPIALDHLRGQAVKDFPTVNEAADAYFTLLEERRGFLAARQQLESSLGARLKKQKALIANLKRERDGYANAAAHQRYGELLLANIHQAVKTERGFQVTDYYDPEQRAIEIPAAGKPDAKEAAEHYFRLARKARHGIEAINERLPGVEREVARLEQATAQLATITTREQLSAFAEGQSPDTRQSKAPPQRAGRKAKEEPLSGVRRYRSSDGYEILVGRSSSDNDRLTFRVARSSDLWFHAADYPGSHVVLRNPQRREIPPRSITEAAQLAAKFSQARQSAKVAVNYCERKFVTKPKGFAPGQVRLSSFKTVMVEPKEAGERVM